MPYLYRALVFIAGLLPLSCHYAVSAPKLWQHNSSAALDMWVAGWIYGLAIFALCCAFAFSKDKQ